MTTHVYDQNGNQLHANIKRACHRDGRRGWAKTMWFGGVNGLATDVITVVFRTRAEARAAWIDDWTHHNPIGRFTDGWEYEN